MEYETKAINMRYEIERNYDVEKRIVTNFSIIPKAVIHLRGRDKFGIEVINKLLDCLIIQLLTREVNHMNTMAKD